MTNPDTQSASPPPPEPLNSASMIRAAADGELNADDRQVFDSLCARDAMNEDRVAFERALRRSTSRAMAEPKHAPQSVRTAIENLFDQERTTTTLSVQTRRRSFWAGRTVWASVAAAIVLITAVSIVSNMPFGGALPQLGPPFAAQLVEASSFVVSEHNRCSTPSSYSNRKFTVRDQNDVSSLATKLLGASPASLALDQTGYVFAGSGKCSVPGSGPSMHVLYKPIDSSRPALSFFVQQNTRPEIIAQGVRYRLMTENGTPVLVWCDDNLIYYLYCPDSDAEQAAAQLLNAPDLEQTI